MNEDQLIWQPIVLIVEQRIECRCGVQALFILFDETPGEDGKKDFNYTTWCRDCFRKDQDE
jgi:hypothetical protein